MTEGADRIKVWDSATKGDANLVIPHDGNDFRKWDISSFPSTLYVEGVYASGAVRDVELWFGYARIINEQEHAIHSNRVKLTVVQVDLDMYAVDDNEETHKGGFILFNDNDNDEDGVVDYDDGYNKDGTWGNDDDWNFFESDLVDITLQKVYPVGLTGSVTLKTLAGGGKIKVWFDRTKWAEIGLPATYSTPADLPNYLYVEGYETSGGVRDVTLALEYSVGGKTFDDKIKVTVVQVDLDMEGVLDNEERKKGGYVGLNDDDDNTNDTPDKDEGEVTISGEDDLEKITLNDVYPLALTGTVTLKAAAGGAKIKVWENSTRGTEVGLPATYSTSTPTELPEYLHVEGYETSGVRGVELRLEYTVEGRTFEDRVKVSVIDVDIVKPKGSLDAVKNPEASWVSSPYHFDFQGLESGATGGYVLDIEGDIDPAPPLGYKWTLDAAAGTLTDDTTATPTHAAPDTEGEGMLELKAMIGTTDTGIEEDRKAKIYEDHLARDYANFETGGSCLATWYVETFNVDPKPGMSTWNCHGSVWHAYNGSGTGNSGSTVGWSQTPYPTPSTTDWTTIQSGLSRGDVVSFWSGSPGSYDLQHSHTCRGSSTNMYGANNEPSVDFDNTPPATWKWYECSSKDYYDAVNAASQSKWGIDFLTLVIVHEKP